ncbi:uncharacterized protein PHACADRAFT_214851 [Phanerochaete carnosa HHB-10118-sp]|uniref:Uncharacterized protein n=1 Tax=Phanerochaete carnosa (strain HHB-10118-sp) TaxID=650164 RepID=K5VP48_PHACS|nr:uncharacterized protein PHACADRAFT_214851 [Phanerochaete carnosa HHB-10118-sp]EKM48324.1 hypothetical protein PHACADRAFT_214851 [Phanerochaete carnosa HHB-10118-sp]
MYLWLDAVLELDRKKLEMWVRKAKHHGWFEDPEIQAQLYAFCEASHETERYEPFCKIANKVLELAKGTLLSRRAKYPIEDFTFVRNDPWYFLTNALHGMNGAKRKPDVVGIRVRHLANLPWAWSGRLSSTSSSSKSTGRRSRPTRGTLNLQSRLHLPQKPSPGGQVFDRPPSSRTTSQ